MKSILLSALALVCATSSAEPIAKVIVSGQRPVDQAIYTIDSDGSVLAKRFAMNYQDGSSQLVPYEVKITGLLAWGIDDIQKIRAQFIGAKITQAQPLKSCIGYRVKDYYLIDAKGASRLAAVRGCTSYTPGGKGKAAADRLMYDLDALLASFFVL